MIELHGNLRRGVFFPVKTGYWIARDLVLGNILSSSSLGDPFLQLWKSLWKAKVPGKVAICAWRACKNLLPTRAKLITKGYSGDLNCLLCNHPFETIGHLVCECPLAKAILCNPPFMLHPVVSPSFSFTEWMLEQAVALTSSNFARLLMFIWSFWKNRNEKLWKNSEMNAPSLLSMTMAWYDEFLQHSQRGLVDPCKSPQMRKSWSPPPEGSLKMNVDGAFLPTFQFGGVGGVLCDHQGSFIAAFSYRKESVSSPLHCELLAIHDGLLFLQAMDVSNVIINSDCQLAVQALSNSNEDLSVLGNLVEDIKVLLSSLPSISFSHAYRTSNTVAHRLAGLGFDLDTHLEWFVHAPDSILDALSYDL